MSKKYDLENRLIDFGVLIIRLTSVLDGSKAAAHLSGQLLRSGTSPVLNYGEAQSSESRKDFIHKIKIILKELRETKANLQLLDRAELLQNKELMASTIKECSELIAIFVKSSETASKNIIVNGRN